MTTLALYSPFVSEGGFKQSVQVVLKQAWTAFVNARMNRAMMMVSFYTAK